MLHQSWYFTELLGSCICVSFLNAVLLLVWTIIIGWLSVDIFVWKMDRKRLFCSTANVVEVWIFDFEILPKTVEFSDLETKIKAIVHVRNPDRPKLYVYYTPYIIRCRVSARKWHWPKLTVALDYTDLPFIGIIVMLTLIWTESQIKIVNIYIYMYIYIYIYIYISY